MVQVIAKADSSVFSKGMHFRGGDERSCPASEVGGGYQRSYPESEARAGGWEELPHAPMPEARGGGREDQPQVQGAVAVRAQEGLEELSHVEGQEGWR